MRQTADVVAIVLVAVFSMGALNGCSSRRTEVTTPATPDPPITITEQDDGKSIKLIKGQTLLVRLAANPTTGYQWMLQGNPAPLELIKSDFTGDPQTKSMAGAGGTQTLQFMARSAGNATLKLEYQRPWEKDVPAAKAFKVTVVVK